MGRMRWRCGFAGVLASVVLFAAGCAREGSPSGPEKGKQPAPVAKKQEHDHSGWWCDEHGLPEEVCDLCNRKYAAAEKKKGNWCEHNRVKTSCFQCNPGLKEKFAREYEAKYGERPPEPTE